MKLLFILQKTKSLIKKIYDIEINDIKQKTDINTRFYAVIKTDVYPKGVIIDLSLVLLETDAGQATNWDKFFELLKPYQVTSYRIRSFGYNVNGEESNHQLKVISASNTVELDIGYSNRFNRSLKNTQVLKDHLTDLTISKRQGVDINFDKCLVSINGIITYPYLIDNEIYCVDGAKCLWHYREKYQPDITLIDFTLLGHIELIRFKDCIKYFQVKEHVEPTISDNILVKLPKSINNKTLLMVLAGTLYFPDEINFARNNSILINPNIIPIRSSITLKNKAKDNVVHDTQMIQSENINKYFTQDIWREDNFDSFFVLIDIADVNVIREQITPDFMKFKDYNIPSHDGYINILRRTHTTRNFLLQNQTTKKIINYVRYPYSDQEIYYSNRDINSTIVSEYNDQYLLDIPYYESELFKNHFFNTEHSRYELVKLIKG